MPYRNSHASYGSVSKFFHWLIFLLVLGMIIYGYALGYFPKSWKPVGYNIHKLVGLSILTLMVLRLLWALCNRKPKLPEATPTWELIAERLLHCSLYLVLLLMPLSGWVMVSAGGHPPKLFGFSFSFPIQQSKSIGHFFGEVHYYLAITIIVIVCLHILAALKHHFIDKDNILKRMMPSKTSKIEVTQ